MGEPIPFIQISDDGVFEIDSKAMNFLQSQNNKKISCIAIAGAYRTGKSFLANRFLNQMKGFEIGSTQQSCTRGIWIWNEPIRINSEVDAFLIDTEGLHSVDRHTDVDSKIFTLSILLSSVFIFNSIGHITEDSIQELALVANLAKMMQLRDSNEEVKYDSQQTQETDEKMPDDVDEEQNHETILFDDEDKAEYNEILPVLYWVLRDFSLDLESFTSSEYLEKCLKKIDGGVQSLKKNKIRDAIKSYFPRRECHPLVRPWFQADDVKNIQELEYSELRPEFRSGVESLLKRIMKRPKLKCVAGKYLTGSMLLGMAMEYIEAINNGEMPTIIDSFERVAHAEAQRYTDELIEKTRTDLKYTINDDCLPMNTEEMEEIFEKIISNRRKLYFKLCESTSAAVIIETQKDFLKSIQDDFKDLRQRNHKASYKKNYEFLAKFAKSLSIPKIKTIDDIPASFINSYYDEYLKLAQEYDKAATGTAKTEAFWAFMQSEFLASHQSLLQDIDLAYKEHINFIALKISELEASKQKSSNAVAELKQTIEQTEEQKEKMIQEKNRLDYEIELLQRTINDSTSEQNK